jgi:hypothetical protein
MAVGVGNDLIHQLGVRAHAAQDRIGLVIVADRRGGRWPSFISLRRRRAASYIASSSEAKWPLYTAACSELSTS